MGGWWRWALVSPGGVAPSQMVSVSASVNLSLHHKVQKFSSGTGSPGWSRKKGRKTAVVVRDINICYLLAASPVCQMPLAVHTSPPAFSVWSSGLLCGWPDGLEQIT